jgi:hypothetical protein
MLAAVHLPEVDSEFVAEQIPSPLLEGVVDVEVLRDDVVRQEVVAVVLGVSVLGSCAKSGRTGSATLATEPSGIGKPVS